MNNEQNKPRELTEKELEGVVGGAKDLVTVTGQAEAWEVDRVGISPVSPVDKQFFKTIICEEPIVK